MKKTFLMQPRQSGKTTKAMYEYLKDSENTVFVCMNYNLARETCKRVGGELKHFISSESFELKLRGCNPKNIILDEYMLFSNKDKIYKIIQELSPENVLVFSTSNKTYSKKLFDLVKNNKKEKTFVEILELYEKENNGIPKEINDEIYELYYNFLTDSDVKLIDKDLLNLPFLEKEDIFSLIGEKNYKLEILNQYLQ
jgi:hypothetical protein